jgi:ectoine hydroxylase-related dioxygenase (phytanoyl-CoA dioxygenase family)
MQKRLLISSREQLDVNAEISRQQIETYERDGTALIPAAFTDWVQPLRESVLAVIEGQRAGTVTPDDAYCVFQNPLTVIEQFGGGAMALNIVPYDPGFADWLDRSSAAEMAATIMRSDKVRFWVDATFLKEENQAAEGTPWHNDTCTWPFWGKQMTILWIALTDVGPQDGPLITVRGSHAGDGRYYSTFFPQDQEPPPGYRPWQELMDQAESPNAEIQTWTMQAGDCLFMHPTTIHGSAPRLADSGRPRLAFSTRWLGDDVVWKPDPLTEPMTVRLVDHPGMTYNAPPPDEIIPLQWPR